MRATEASSESLELPDGRRVSWREYGVTDGRPLFYCHGLPGSRLEPKLLEAAAGERQLRVVCLDRPGYGGTSPLPGRRMGDEAVDLRAVADRLDLQHFDVIGFSAGGAHALACAADMRDRVRRVSLVSSCAPFDCVSKDGMAEHFRELWELAERDNAAFRQTLEQSVAAAGGAYELLLGGAPEEDRAILLQPAVAETYRRSAAEATSQGVAGMCEDACALVSPWPFDIERVDCPVHIWHGIRDCNVPIGMGRWLADRMPNARMTEWPEVAHFAAFDRWSYILNEH